MLMIYSYFSANKIWGIHNELLQTIEYYQKMLAAEGYQLVPSQEFDYPGPRFTIDKKGIYQCSYTQKRRVVSYYSRIL